jgi:hypothetical protein
MANVLSLALRVTADATGLKLDPVQRALVGLGDQADKLTSQFDQFAAGSGAAAAASADFAARSQELINTLRDNGSATQFAAAFEKLNAEARELAVAFAEGQRVTEANRTEEERRAITLAKLNDLLDKGAISQDVFNRAAAEASGANADAARAAAESAQVQAEAVRLQAEGQRITEANRTEEEKRAITLARLNELFDQGAIGQETFNRASAEASGANAEAARAAGEAARVQAEAAKVQSDALRQRQALESRAASIINANLTAQERYEQSLRELNDLQRQGLLTQEQYNRAVAAARKPLDDAAAASARVAEAGKESALQFNELSGVFAILPGSLGNIAGRLSGLTSAGEGLSRVFSGGLKQGIASIGQTVAGLVNPFTIAAAGIVGFGAAATAITRGLIDLEARVKSLGAAAEQLGVSFETIQVLEEAASRAGTSLDAAAAGIQKFAARIDDARSGTGAAAEAFRELGISQEELANTAPTELAARVAEELGKIEDPARRAALQVDLLGKSGEELRRTFAELPGAADDLEKFGAAISPEDRARIEALGPAFDGFGVALRGLGQSVITPFAGIVAGLTETLASLINVVTTVAQVIGFVLTPVLDGIGAAFSVVADGINNTVGFFRSFFSSTDEAAEKVETLRAAAEEATEFDDASAKAFEKTLEGVRSKLSEAVDESVNFGQAGFDAALQYQNSIDELQRQFDRGIINEESFKRAAEQANEAYEQQIQVLSRAADAAEQKAAAEIAAVDKLIEASEQQQRIANEFGGSDQRFQAAQNLVAIETEIARVEEQQRIARAAGDTAAADAATARLASLDQVAARERDIASGAAEEREAAAKAADDLTKKLFAEAQKRADAEVAAREKIEEAQAAFRERQFEVDLARLEELNTVRTGAVEVGDIRSGGIGAFFATLQEDPAVSEAKKQTAELTKLNKNIEKLEAQRVDILAGTG